MFSRRVLSSCRPLTKAHPTLGASRRLATVVETPASSSAVPPAANEASEETTYSNTVTRKGIVHTGIILNRHPILTRTPTKLELAYYNYQSRIERALHNPIPYEFYFRPGSLLEGQFNEEESAREREAFGRVSHVSDTKNSFNVDSTQEPLTLMPRRNAADFSGDVKSLNRKGDRNLYLVVKSAESGKETWKFPQTELVGEELLHEAAKRELRSQYAMGMDTWVVGRIPAGVYRPSSAPEDTYVFLYKAHILQGQVRPDGKKVLDFAWLAKEEIKTKVDENYWDGVKDILSDF